MKNYGRIVVGIASNEASSAQNQQKSKSRLCRKFLFFTASALICATLGLAPSAKASDSLTISGIQSALRGDTAQPAGDAVSALSSFAQQIGAPAAKAAAKVDDPAFATLQDFAQRLGTVQPQSIKTLPQTAEAKTLLEFLQQRGSSSETAAPAKPRRAAAPVDAHVVGSKACATCHAAAIAEFNKTLMGKIGHTPQGRGKFECENCHGPGSAHVKAGGGRGVGGILSFGADDPRSTDEKNGLCLSCHQKGERNYWAGSVHQTRGVACTSCHTVMKNVSHKHSLKTKVEAETCYQCHKIQRAQMQYSSHMPIREGKITCTNCHNPHGSITGKLIREASVNDNCYKCHAEKRGPFLWQHAPVNENCLNCHSPHGSNYENLLVVARSRLCAECHRSAHGTSGFIGPNNPGGPTAYILGRGCGNCHSNIHGSNAPNGIYFLR